MENINLYLKNGKSDELIFNDFILNEAFSMKDLTNMVGNFKNLSKTLVNLSNKKDVKRFLRKNSSSLKKVVKYMVKNFDPFGSEIPIEQPKQEPERTFEPEKIEKTPEEKKEPIKKKKEKVTEKDFEIGRQKIIEMLKNFYNMLKRKISNFDIDFQKLMKVFDAIYFIIIRGVEATMLGSLFYLFGPGIVGIISLIYLLVIIANMVYMKRMNEHMTIGEAFLQSSKEMIMSLKKMISSIKIQKGEGGIAILWSLAMSFFVILKTSFPLFATLGSTVTGISSLLLIAICLSWALYLILELFDRLPREEQAS